MTEVDSSSSTSVSSQTAVRRRSAAHKQARLADDEQYYPSRGRCPDARGDDSFSKYLGDRQKRFCSYVLGLLVACHQVGSFRPYTSKFLYLQYLDPTTGYASIGLDDIYFVATWVVVLTLLRVVLMDYALMPMAKTWKIPVKKRFRFAEQGWSVAYYTSSWLAGMYLLYNSEYAFSARHFWIGWPHYELHPFMKAYYLVQMASWVSQIYVLNVEEKRKDYVQMFTHHIITCCLVAGSYYYFYTRVGHVIMVLMDVVDTILSTAKMLKYNGYNRLCDALFGLFLVSWISGRHVIYNYITYSAWRHVPHIIKTGCYFDQNGLHKRCFTPTVHVSFVALLVSLQIITLFWLYYILRVVWGIINGQSADDNRSDDEHED